MSLIVTEVVSLNKKKIIAVYIVVNGESGCVVSECEELDRGWV